MRDFHRPGRSAVYATGGMAATSHPLASEAAIAALRDGGNAVDAALSAVLVQCVVEPHMVGIGGDAFALVAMPDGEIFALNGSGRAPARADPQRLREEGLDDIGEDCVHAITAPGAVRAFEALAGRFGKFGLDRALARAIDLAENGFAVAPRVGADWADRKDKLSRHEGARRHLLFDGEPPGVGDVISLPALAKTLRIIAEKGSEGFYSGTVAADIAASVKAAGGLLDEADLAAVSADWESPISRAYRGLEVIEARPNGQGAIALLMMGILERFDHSGLDPLGAPRLHLQMEAARAAYGVRDEALGDPAAMSVPTEALFADGLIDRLAGRIDPARRNPDLGSPEPVGSDTVYLSVVDGEGMVVSLIASLYHWFGSGVVSAKTGVTLHSRGACFNLIDGHVNCYGPGKRSLHTLIPALARRDGRITAGFGVMGAHYQVTGHAHVIGNIVDFGMDPQAAIDCPRIFFDGDGKLVAETGIDAAVADGLTALGHEVVYGRLPWGGGQMVWIDHQRGCLIGASDPRKDGCALGL